MRTLTITVEVKDDEFQNFVNRLADSGKVSIQDGDTTDDTGPVNTNAPALDANGVPWMEAIHASTKGVVADGTWRGKKGVTKEQRAAAESAYKAANVNPAPFVTGNNPPITIPGLPGMPSVGGLPGMPSPAPVAPQPVSYEQIMAKFAELTPTGKFGANFELLTGPNGIYTRCGITDVTALHTDEALRFKLMTELNAL